MTNHEQRHYEALAWINAYNKGDQSTKDKMVKIERQKKCQLPHPMLRNMERKHE